MILNDSFAKQNKKDPQKRTPKTRQKVSKVGSAIRAQNAFWWVRAGSGPVRAHTILNDSFAKTNKSERSSCSKTFGKYVFAKLSFKITWAQLGPDPARTHAKVWVRMGPDPIRTHRNIHFWTVSVSIEKKSTVCYVNWILWNEKTLFEQVFYIFVSGPNFAHCFVRKLLRRFAFCPFGDRLVFLGLLRKTPKNRKRTPKIFKQKYGPNFCHRFVLKVVTQIRFLSLWWPSSVFGAVKEAPQQHKTNIKDCKNK